MTETTTLNVRGITRTAVDRIKLAAAVRGMTIGEYLTQLVDFHDAARALADAGEQRVQTELETRSLQTVKA